MKKKGLIISTVVMVVVLIAALTTATFAWFSTSATAKIDDINMEVKASADVLIGVGNSASTSRTAYFNGEPEFTHDSSLKKANEASGTWAGGTTGLGTTLTLGLTLDVGRAVGTSESGTTMDASPDNTHSYYTAVSTDNTNNDVNHLDTPQEARINGTTTTSTTSDDGNTDVVDLQMGIIPATASIWGMYCKITITVPTAQGMMGMITALRLEVSADSKTYAGQIFDLGTAKHWNDEPSSGTYTFYFIIKDKGAEALKTTANDVVPFSIKFYIDGTDQDCVTDATGTSATISLEFDGIGESDEFATAASGATQITLNS